MLFFNVLKFFELVPASVTNIIVSRHDDFCFKTVNGDLANQLSASTHHRKYSPQVYHLRECLQSGDSGQRLNYLVKVGCGILIIDEMAK